MMAVVSPGWSGMSSYAVFLLLFGKNQNCKIWFHFGDSKGMCGPIKIRFSLMKYVFKNASSCT